MESILEILAINLHVVFTQVLIILALLAIMKVFLHRPIQDMFRKRTEMIAGNMAAAEEHKTKAETLRQEYEARLADIANEARSRLDQAMKDAEAARVRVMDAAQNDISDLHQRYQRQLALEREQMRRELQAEVSDLAVMVATKALRDRLTPEIQAAVIDQALEDLEKLPLEFAEPAGETANST